MSKFWLGEIIEAFEYDLDGSKIKIVKYQPNKFTNGQIVHGEYENEPAYHVEKHNTSYLSIDEALIADIAYRRLGMNQHPLVSGIVRALCIK